MVVHSEVGKQHARELIVQISQMYGLGMVTRDQVDEILGLKPTFAEKEEQVFQPVSEWIRAGEAAAESE